MKREPVVSSSLSSLGYDRQNRRLEAEFRNGGVYEYFDVPARLVEELLAASSLGAFFNARIRESFRCRQVSRPPRRGKPHAKRAA
jgi:hypothetical protein